MTDKAAKGHGSLWSAVLPHFRPLFFAHLSHCQSDPMYTLLNQSDYCEKDVPCFLFISFSFQRSVSPDPALNYDYYHSGRQSDSFPRGTTATDPETLQLIWGSTDQSGECRTGGRGVREREWEHRKQTCRLFTEKIAHKLASTFFFIHSSNSPT